MGKGAISRRYGEKRAFFQELSESLSLYAKQLAWLHSAPKRNKNDESPPARMVRLKEGDPARKLPETDIYLSRCFQLSGLFSSNGMGISPLSWVELSAFTKLSGYALTGWEAEQVITMSQVYCNMHNKAKILGCPAPYLDNISTEESKKLVRDKVSKQWESFEKKLDVKRRNK